MTNVIHYIPHCKKLVGYLYWTMKYKSDGGRYRRKETNISMALVTLNERMDFVLVFLNIKLKPIEKLLDREFE